MEWEVETLGGSWGLTLRREEMLAAKTRARDETWDTEGRMKSEGMSEREKKGSQQEGFQLASLRSHLIWLVCSRYTQDFHTLLTQWPPVGCPLLLQMNAQKYTSTVMCKCLKSTQMCLLLPLNSHTFLYTFVVPLNNLHTHIHLKLYNIKPSKNIIPQFSMGCMSSFQIIALWESVYYIIPSVKQRPKYFLLLLPKVIPPLIDLLATNESPAEKSLKKSQFNCAALYAKLL